MVNSRSGLTPKEIRARKHELFTRNAILTDAATARDFHSFVTQRVVWRVVRFYQHWLRQPSVKWFRYEDMVNPSDRLSEVELLRLVDATGVNPEGLGARARCVIGHSQNPKRTTIKESSSGCLSDEKTQTCLEAAAHRGRSTSLKRRANHPAVRKCLRRSCTYRYFVTGANNLVGEILSHAGFITILEKMASCGELSSLWRNAQV